MEVKRTSVFENSLIWFGAGVSIAEILTGTYLAPLGFQKGLAAIIVGHVIGCALLFFIYRKLLNSHCRIATPWLGLHPCVPRGFRYLGGSK